MKLAEILMKYTTKQELGEISDYLDLPVSGTKQEYIERIVAKSGGKRTRKILLYLSRDSIVQICRENGIETKGRLGLPYATDYLVDEIIDKVLEKEVMDVGQSQKAAMMPSAIQGLKSFLGKPPDKTMTNGDQKSIQDLKERPEERPVQSQKEPEGPSIGQDKLYDILSRYTFKDDLYYVAVKLELPVSGTKEELLTRILDRTNRDPQVTLTLFDNSTLQNIAEKLALPRRRGKEDQLDELLRGVFGIEMIKAPPQAPPSKEGVAKVTTIEHAPAPTKGPELGSADSCSNPLFIRIVKEIIEWVPDETYRHEEGYRTDLKAFLKARGFVTRRETGDSRVDILINDCIPIEIKKNPSKAEYTRAKGQMDNYCKEYGAGIAVICDAGNADLYDDFDRDIARVCRGYPVKVIKKR